MRYSPFLALGVLALGVLVAHAASQYPKRTPATILHELQLGNRRFATNHPLRPRSTPHRRQEVVDYGQHPKAIVLSCSDSRVPPELLFDQGLGDLFTIRVAGNVSNADEIASAEYAAEHLHTSVIVVLGHTKCGAVTAVVNGDQLPGPNLPKLAEHIHDSVVQTRANHPGLHGTPLIETAIEDNVRTSMAAMHHNSPVLQHLLEEKHLTIVGAVYDLKTGRVHWLDGPEHHEAKHK